MASSPGEMKPLLGNRGRVPQAQNKLDLPHGTADAPGRSPRRRSRGRPVHKSPRGGGCGRLPAAARRPKWEDPRWLPHFPIRPATHVAVHAGTHAGDWRRVPPPDATTRPDCRAARSDRPRWRASSSCAAAPRLDNHRLQQAQLRVQLGGKPPPSRASNLPLRQVVRQTTGGQAGFDTSSQSRASPSSAAHRLPLTGETAARADEEKYCGNRKQNQTNRGRVGEFHALARFSCSGRLLKVRQSEKTTFALVL